MQGRRAVLTPAGAGAVPSRQGAARRRGAPRALGGGPRAAAGSRNSGSPSTSIFPTWLLLRAMARFGEERPGDPHRVDRVRAGRHRGCTDRRAAWISSIGSQVPPGFVGDALMQVRFVCAASPSHPLHALGRPLTLDDLREHRHLVVRDSGARRTRSGGWLNERRWTVSNKATSIRAACMGLGFAWYAEENIRRGTRLRFARAAAAGRGRRTLRDAVPRLRGQRQAAGSRRSRGSSRSSATEVAQHGRRAG